MVYTTLTDFSTKYLMMCKVYTDVGGIKWLYYVCPHVGKIIDSLKLKNYLQVQGYNPCYNYYIIREAIIICLNQYFEADFSILRGLSCKPNIYVS